jgi:hypothetical protein
VEDALVMEDGSIVTDSSGDGAAGNVTVTAGSTAHRSRRDRLFRHASRSSGSSGNVEVIADTMSLKDADISTLSVAGGGAGNLTVLAVRSTCNRA